jgi:hypothetical protein
VLEIVLKEFQIITSSVVWRELEATAKFDDPDGRAAHHVLACGTGCMSSFWVR